MHVDDGKERVKEELSIEKMTKVSLTIPGLGIF
jgi:hypothetical protein